MATKTHADPVQVDNMTPLPTHRRDSGASMFDRWMRIIQVILVVLVAFVAYFGVPWVKWQTASAYDCEAFRKGFSQQDDEKKAALNELRIKLDAIGVNIYDLRLLIEKHMAADPTRKTQP